MTVRTRFAPSPTGYLHIGGVRTALFNWLYARKLGGQFILRIDDTDTKRNVAEALQPILDGFRWLGLDWDEGPEKGGPHGPYYQSEKTARYQEAVKQLLDKGLAYWDYATPEETDAERKEHDARVKAKAATGPYIYSRRWMAETDADRKRFEAEGRKGAVKVKMPREGTCRFTDHVRGEIAVEWAGEQDIVIQRSDGGVTYNLANVVDDFDMKITHVIRAEEHLSNTPRQIFMLEGLGYPRPEYAHVPFVAEPGSKNKLSKRKIAQYLKNPDFRNVYVHGHSLLRKSGWKAALDMAEIVQSTTKHILESTGKPSGSEQRKQIRLQVIKRLFSTEKAKVETPQWRAAWTLVTNEILEEILEHPDQLKQFEHGQKILQKLGPDLPPEAFNPVLIDFYKQVGYLPSAILNYLVLLGWSLNDHREDFTLSEMIELFSLERINKDSASLDVKKLFAFQARYMQALPLADKVLLVVPFLVNADLVPEDIEEKSSEDVTSLMEKIVRTVEATGPRMTVAGDILDYDYLFLPDDRIEFDPAVATKHLAAAYKGAASVPPLVEVLTKLRAVVAGAEPFTHDTLKAATEALAAAGGAKAGPLSQVLRVATTGKEVGFSAYDTLAVLGRDRCLARIDRALTQV